MNTTIWVNLQEMGILQESGNLLGGCLTVKN